MVPHHSHRACDSGGGLGRCADRPDERGNGTLEALRLDDSALAQALTLLVGGVFLVGLYPQPLFDLVEQGAVAMMAASEAVGAVGAPP